MDNDVKVMLFVDQHVLLVCGSVSQGMCHLYSNNNLNLTGLLIGHPDKTWNYVGGRSEVVAFFADNYLGDQALYSACTYDHRPDKLTDYTVSSRIIATDVSVPKSKLSFSYTYQSDNTVSALTLHPLYKDLARYIYGFAHEGYAYFLLTQQRRRNEEPFETRLARVCQNDTQFFSYSEVTVRCMKESALPYDLATTAYLGDISKNLRNARDVEDERKVLYVAFSRHGKGGEPVARLGSVLCMFPMSQIQSAFLNATRECLTGGLGARRIKSLLGTEVKCEMKPLSAESLQEALCDPGSNHYIEGKDPVPGGLRAFLEHEVASSLAVTVQGDRTVAFVGTSNGSLAKFVLDPNREEYLMYKVPLDPDPEGPLREVRSRHVFDEQRQNLYLLTGNKVVKFPTGSCSPHSNCRSCVGSKDPLGCGWCVDRCASRQECTPEGAFQDDQCPPFIYKVYPQNGHRNGGTLLTIEGDNFGTKHQESMSKINVTVAGVGCEVLIWEYEKIICRTNGMDKDSSGPVVVIAEDRSYDQKLDVDGTAVSETNFTYLSPRLFGVTPFYGAMSGGTNVTLKGEHLDIGSRQLVRLAGINCTISFMNASHIECNSGPYPKPKKEEVKGSVVVEIDQNAISTNGGNTDKGVFHGRFLYRPDPIVVDITPNVTTWSGGTNLLVSGYNLDSVSNPRMVVTVTHAVSARQHDIIQTCNPGEPADRNVVCKTPSLNGVPEAGDEPPAQAPVRTHISFLMDGVVNLRRFSHEHPHLSQLLYYPDPVFYSFHRNVSQVRTDTMELIIKGKNLNLAHRREDVVVAVNYTLRCNVTKLTFDTLHCILPTHLNSTMMYNAGPQRPVPIVVKAGNREFSVGGVTLVNPPEGLSAGAVAGIALSFSLLLAALFLFLYKRGILRVSPFGKKIGRNQYTAAYTAEPRNRNDYQHYPSDTSGSGLREGRSSCAAEESNGPKVSDETMHLLTVDNILVARDYLALEKEIGQGHFGRVYKGELQLPGEDEARHVAVKTLHNCRYQDVEATESFLQEGLMMKDFRHQHVLTLIGVCFEDTGFPMVILPFMKHGDLRSYIQDENNEPTIKILIDFGIQIAEGMKYLSELKFVHRDLAARNCMLDEDYTVKVADFGLSRDIYERDYYSSDNKKSKLPVKWMAPESLEKGTYSTKSDVWSFGVVMWELMTRGVTPYPEVGNWEILNFVKAGRRMLQPSYCPDPLYKIMLRCWSDDSRKRPTFSELAVEMKAVIKKMENRHRKVGLNVTYVNVPNPGEEEAGPMGAV